MTHLYTLVVLIACAASCLRLLTFERAGARYRPWMSLCAWLLIVSTGSTALRILLHPDQPVQIGPGIVVILVVLAVLIFNARGNVAHILRRQP